MKIGIDARLYSQTGVGRYIRNLIDQLKIIDTKNSYVIFLNSKDYKGFVLPSVGWEKRKVDIHWHSLAEQILLPNILLKEKCDLIHFPYFSTPILYSGKFVITIHDLIMNHFSTGYASSLPLPLYKLKFIFYRLIMQAALKKSAKIIAVSKATKQEIKNHYSMPDSKISVIYEASEITHETEDVSRNNLSDKKYFLYVGNAYPHKNLETVISAFKKISDNYKNVQLILVGGKDYFYTRLLNKIMEQKIPNIVLRVSVSDNELIYLYKNAVGLILPSFMEGFGLPAVEAMTLGCPVIASKIPSLTEVCGQAATYFNPLDSDELREIIIQYLENADPKIRTKQIQLGCKQSKKYSWEKTAKETLQTYESCTGL